MTSGKISSSYKQQEHQTPGSGKKQIAEVVILFKMYRLQQKIVMYAQKHNGPYKERKNNQKKLFLRKPQTVNLLDKDLKIF